MSLLTNHAKFTLAERAEQLAADVYGAIADRLEHDPDGAAVFRRLRGEEQQHALRVRMLANEFMRQPQAFRDVPVDADFLETAIAEAESILAEVQADRAPLQFERACNLAIALEHTLAVSSSAMMVAEADPAIQRFFGSLAQQDRNHEDLLAGRISRSGPSPSRRPPPMR
jgi:rubrerythrin